MPRKSPKKDCPAKLCGKVDDLCEYCSIYNGMFKATTKYGSKEELDCRLVLALLNRDAHAIYCDPEVNKYLGDLLKPYVLDGTIVREDQEHGIVKYSRCSQQ